MEPARPEMSCTRLKITCWRCRLAEHMNGEAEDSIAKANARFYRALESGSLEQMDEIWLHDDCTRCVHPGWEMISGWERVKKSWARIFESGQRMRVSPTELQIWTLGEVACVTCKENITIFDDASFDSAQAVATNVFVLSDGIWLMMVHHSSPVPVLVPDAATDTIQ